MRPDAKACLAALAVAALAVAALACSGRVKGGPAIDGAPVSADAPPAGWIDARPAADAPACLGPPPANSLAVHTAGGGPVSPAGPFLVLTGTAWTTIDGSPLASVTIDGSTRGVRLDPARGVWTYVLAHAGPGARAVEVVAIGASGMASGPLVVPVNLPSPPPTPARDLAASDHAVGAWMFTWFNGPGSGWECGSPWRPVAGFDAWDGSVAWARGQLLDQLHANLDLVGLQLDTVASTGGGSRWEHVVNALRAARELWDEGHAPPRLLPLVDTAILADLYLAANGHALDLATTAGRDHLYAFPREFQAALEAELGPHAAAAAARTAGRPWVALWHSVTIDGESEASVRELKARFAADFGVEPYLVAHPNDWRLLPAVDEITLMFGPPTHFYQGGRDATGAPTANLEPGFWNPISNPHYLPRQGGVHYDDAWASALAARATVHHLYIDSWNETGEGSGIFEGEPLTYGADSAGPCGTFVNRHDEAWGPTSRHYIDATAEGARAWNDAPDLDARLVAHDLPATMRPGEQRWATVVLRNAGDRAWNAAGGPRLAPRPGSAAFGIAEPAAPLYGADARGHPMDAPRGLAVPFPILLAAPCEPGAHPVRLGLLDAAAGAFGEEVAVTVTIEE